MIEEFLKKENKVAVVGASTNPEKYGYRIFAHLLKDGYKVFPINPKRPVIEGVQACANLSECEETPDVVIMVIAPEKQKALLEEIVKLGIDKVWFQPGSESEENISFLKEKGIKVVHGLCYVRDGLGEPLMEFIF
ncbi:MAG: CoA-binding protein [Candidatus Micrarchaeota archaeon]|nr:CoA-binding protein [Candidatus Micrarchaeota archaeon]